MQILKVLFIIFEVVLLFNLLILVHELGHYLAARWRGLKIERFGIWFGKALWQKEINGVVYCLGSIPAGGYVALPQMAPMDAIEGRTEKGESLPPISALDKVIVAFAGPLFSFGLALLFALLVWWIGRPVSEAETTTTVGYVLKGSPAEKAGMKPGDRILSVDGFAVNRFTGIGDSVTWRVVSSTGDTIPIEVERGGKRLRIDTGYVREPTKAWERSSLRQIQIAPRRTALVAKVLPNSPAARAGLRPNDVIVAVDGARLHNPESLSDHIETLAPGTTVRLQVERGSKTLEISAVPELPAGFPSDYPEDQKGPKLGIEWERTGRWTVDHPGPLQQVSMSVKSMVSTFAALFTPKSDVKAQHLSGFVGILRIYYVLFEDAQGWRQAIWFSVILNVNLALLNLLPIPVLDGGHIVLALLEAARRRPIRARTLAVVQNACAFLIIGYMLYITFYDVQDLPWKRGGTGELRFDAKPAAAAPARP